MEVEVEVEAGVEAEEEAEMEVLEQRGMDLSIAGWVLAADTKIHFRRKRR